MIPAVMDPDTRSPGEREVFNRLRDDPGTADWVVLHSFNLPQHRTQLQGEADFVILAPGLGMLCLEVKAHRRVRRGEDGLWHLGSGPATPRSPFKQAEDNMRSLIDILSRRRRQESEALIAWSAVLFTHCEFRVPPVEWREWEVLDQRDFNHRPISALVEAVLLRAREELPRKAQAGLPTARQCENIASALRPVFEVVQTAASRRGEQDDELRSFTEEQFIALDSMRRNPRVVFAGPAGTGKTLLAIEAASRAAAEGHRVLLLCFNRLLGDWLAREGGVVPGVQVARLHPRMLQTAGCAVPRDAGDSFFTSELPDRAVGALLEQDAAPAVDVLVVDEAQDILRESYLDFLDLLLAGGLAAGKWMMFGDFERQALYDAANMPLDSFLALRATAPVYELRVNCRNTPRIARWVTLLGGLRPGYARVLRPDAGPPPRTRYFKSPEEQEQDLIDVLEELYRAGYEGRDIVVLSFKRHGAAATRLSDGKWENRMRPYGTDTPVGHVRHTTVHAFKGLEAPAIVLTDVEAIQGQRAESLFYTGITRATERLYVLADATIADEVVDVLDRYVPEEAAS